MPIPDRIDRGQCRIAVQLTPTLKPRPSGTIDVTQWPIEIARRVQRVRLHVGSYENNRISNRASPIELVTDLAAIYGDPRTGVVDGGIADAANKKWQETFPPETNWDAIFGAMDDNGAESAKETLLVQGSDAVEGPAGALLDELITEFYKHAQARELEFERKLHASLRQARGAAPDIPGNRVQGLPWRKIADALRLEERRGEYVMAKRDRYQAKLALRQQLVNSDPQTLVEIMRSAVSESRERRNYLEQFFKPIEQNLAPEPAFEAILAKLTEFGKQEHEMVRLPRRCWILRNPTQLSPHPMTLKASQ